MSPWARRLSFHSSRFRATTKTSLNLFRFQSSPPVAPRHGTSIKVDKPYWEAGKIPQIHNYVTIRRLASQTNSASGDGPPGATRLEPREATFINIRLPDPSLSQAEHEPEIEIPFSPDFWESSKMKASTSQAPSEPALPKLLVVSGETSHLGHGPSHVLDEALASVREPSPVSSAKPEPRGETGLLQDVVDELGLPTAFRLPDKEPEPSAQRGELTREGKDALWALLAFIGIVWVVGSIVHKPSREKEHR